jgi:glycosyltransferase involved in cell wall biosynthesis
MAHPEWSFVFVGPQAPHPEVVGFIAKLSVQANVHFLGGKSVHELPRYPQHFDVCIMPYRLDDYTKYISPLKLQEYLAGGQPIVAAPIRSLLEFAPVIRLASTPDDWSTALSQAISPETVSIDQIELRREIARHFDWEIIVQNIARSLCDRLGSAYQEQFWQRAPRNRGTCPGRGGDNR